MNRERPVVAALVLCLVLAACTAGPRPAPPPASGDRTGSGTASRMGESPGAAPGGGAPVLLPVPDDPSISLMVWFRVGSQDDPPGKEGLAQLTADLVAEGATESRSYQQILEALYPLAASYEARADKEITTLSGRTHRDNLDTFVELYTEAFLAPRFSEEDFERLRSRQLNALEKDLRYADDEELAKTVLTGFVFSGTRYEHPILGTEAGLGAITLDDVEAFYRRHYTQENAVLALGGGYPPGLVGQLQQALARLPAGQPGRVPAPQPPPLSGRQVLLVDKPDADASISFGFPIDVHRGERDFYALWLAASWLGEHRNSSSHLYQVIREKRGLNYGDYAYVEAFPEGGRRQFPPTNVARRAQLFEVWIRTLPNEQAVFALRAALRELDRLVEQGMSEEDFELTRSFLKKYVLHYAPTTLRRLGYAVDDRFYGVGEPGHLERFQERLAELTLEEVNATIRRHWQADDLKIVVVTGDAETLRRHLVSGEPTPIEYAAPKPPEILAEDEEIARFPLGIRAEDVTVVPVDELFAE